MMLPAKEKVTPVISSVVPKSLHQIQLWPPQLWGKQT